MTSRIRMTAPVVSALTVLLGGSLIAPQAGAYMLVDNPTSTFSFNLEGVAGAFHSQQGYAQSETATQGGRDWQEGFVKYGVDGSRVLGEQEGTLYGRVDWVSSGTWGQGDAAGYTTGDERRTHLENLYMGWKSGSMFPVLGQDGVDISVGRQAITVGDGFLISGDSLSLGKGVLGGQLDRGGAYYLAGRQAFEKTAVLRLGGEQGWRSDLMWLESGNPAQAKSELGVATLEHVSKAGTLGGTFIDVLNTDNDYDFLYPDREGTRVYSVRGQGNAGVEDLFLGAQYAYQRQGDGASENAWYMEAGWTFSSLPWAPYVSYRFTRFSSGYDSLFYGNGRALGTWFQGEVAANYAGPFNSNARVQQLNMTLTPSPQWTLGAMLYDFDTIDQGSGTNLDGNEIDLYAVWAINDHWWVMPLVGRYSPDASADGGGSQIGSDDTNYYSQLLVGFNF